MEALFFEKYNSEYIFAKQPLSHFEAKIENLLSNSSLNPKMVLLPSPSLFPTLFPLYHIIICEMWFIVCVLNW